MNKGVLPRLVSFLRIGHSHKIQFEAAWAVTNICCGSVEQTAEVVNCPSALPNLVNLLDSDSDEVLEQSIWALGNIAGDSAGCAANRDILLNLGILSKLKPLLCTEHAIASRPMSLLRIAAWTLSNLCRNKPSADWKYLQLMINTLSVMLTSDDEEILGDSCWTLTYLSDVDDDSKEKALDILSAINTSGSLERLISLL